MDTKKRERKFIEEQIQYFKSKLNGNEKDSVYLNTINSLEELLKIEEIPFHVFTEYDNVQEEKESESDYNNNDIIGILNQKRVGIEDDISQNVNTKDTNITPKTKPTMKIAHPLTTNKREISHDSNKKLPKKQKTILEETESSDSEETLNTDETESRDIYTNTPIEHKEIAVKKQQITQTTKDTHKSSKKKKEVLNPMICTDCNLPIAGRINHVIIRCCRKNKKCLDGHYEIEKKYNSESKFYKNLIKRDNKMNKKDNDLVESEANQDKQEENSNEKEEKNKTQEKVEDSDEETIKQIQMAQQDSEDSQESNSSDSEEE